jgi:hypothetical protein
VELCGRAIVIENAGANPADKEPQSTAEYRKPNTENQIPKTA